MKATKKILLIALSAMLIVSLTLGVSMIAFADTATKDHEFNAKNDVVFEDFDREDISNTVTASGEGVKLGEKPYLHVEYTAGTSNSPADAIYKQGSGSLNQVQNGGKIILSMRAPKGDVELSEIKFGIRGVDNDAAVFAKTLDQLVDSEGTALPALTAEWQTYEISFATNYEDTDVYPNSATESNQEGEKVLNTPLLAIHIYAATAEAAGTLDIASVKYATTGENLLNDFIGGANVQDTAKNADAGTWWAGSSEGYIVKRAVKMTSGSFTVVKDAAVGKYSYAVIEAQGDVENLKVATTADGTTWGEAVAYDGYSVALTGAEKGFKFIYDGEDEDGVTVNRIYLTNVVVPVPAIAIPVIDASTAELLENFDVAQTGFTGVWEDMSTAPQLEAAGLEYRLSYNNGDKVEVKDGALVFDATNLAETEFINFKFKSKTAAKGDYIVLKVKAEDGANLNSFRFNLGNPEDLAGDVIWTNQMKAGVDYPIAMLGDSNPYKTGDWYYVVINLDESGFRLFEDGYSMMDIYYSGAGKLYIDNVFFCNAVEVNVPNVERDLEFADSKYESAAVGEVTGYQYLYVLNEGYGTTLEFDITAKEDDFDISNLRLEFAGVGTYWASENAEGTLKTTDGKMLNELTYTKDVATHVVIDLAASGIEGEFMHVHNHMHNIGAYILDNVKLHVSIPAIEAKDLDIENAISDTTEKEFTPTQEGYQGAFGYDVPENVYAKLEFTLVPGADFDITALRFTGPAEYWFAQHEDAVITADGKKVTELTFEEGTPINFALNLAELGMTNSFHEVFFHTAGTDTGAFKITSFKATAYVDYITPVYAPKYAEQMELIPANLDKVAPTVTITTATTAKAGDEITIAYTASDNLTAAADLEVTVTVTKDGSAVTLSNNKFTAAEGVYTVTVKAVDTNGNEGSATIQITVSAAQTGNNGDPKPTEPTENDGLTPGAIAGIVIGCVAVVAIAGVVVFMVLKRKKG